MYFNTKVNKSNAQHAARNSPSKNLCSVDNRLRKICAKGKLHGASMHFYYFLPPPILTFKEITCNLVHNSSTIYQKTHKLFFKRSLNVKDLR